MKKSICVFFFSVVSLPLIFSQTSFTPPKDPILTTPEDYASYEPDMVNAAKWLEETPLENNQDKRVQVNAFVFVWVSGSPTVNLTLSVRLTDYFKKNPDLMVLYMAAYSRHIIENPSTFTVKSAAKAALLSVLTSYENSKAKKEKALETLKKDKGNIDKYVDEIIVE